jgi:hypothetical protein
MKKVNYLRLQRRQDIILKNDQFEDIPSTHCSTANRPSCAGLGNSFYLFPVQVRLNSYSSLLASKKLTAQCARIEKEGGAEICGGIIHNVDKVRLFVRPGSIHHLMRSFVCKANSSAEL